MPSLRLIDAPQDAAGERQYILAGQLLEALGQEHEALKAGDADAVNAAATVKLRLLKALDPSAHARLPAASRERIEALLRQAREANLRNGEYLAAQQIYMRARWAGLASIAGLPNLYSADGFNHVKGKTGYSLGQA
jgi:flagellar biosynthesis/type III secretory pathway chaperone